MDNAYLQDLIDETHSRGGGMVLNLDGSPAVVVLSIERYNQIMNKGDETLESSVNNQPTNIVMEKGKVLVTGGAGYIGSHAARELLKAGYDVVIIDNLSSGKRHNVPVNAVFVEGDLADVGLLRDLFAQHKFSGVLHFAASIEVEESVSEPEKYFNNNVANTEKLLSVMSEYGVKNIIFSSTAAVYGEPEVMPINESAKLAPMNPYGYSKLIAERVIKYHCQFMGLRAIVFRYFNACGCDFEGDIELTHHTHLISTVMEVAVGKKPFITVFGKDYKTFDGSCVRDYVHVLDIAKAHVQALRKITEGDSYRVYNIGTGKGNSVLEIINKTSETLNKIIPMEDGPRRAGDPAVLIADNKKLRDELGYALEYSDLETILKTSFKQAQNFK